MVEQLASKYGVLIVNVYACHVRDYDLRGTAFIAAMAVVIDPDIAQPTSSWCCIKTFPSHRLVGVSSQESPVYLAV